MAVLTPKKGAKGNQGYDDEIAIRMRSVEFLFYPNEGN